MTAGKWQATCLVRCARQHRAFDAAAIRGARTARRERTGLQHLAGLRRLSRERRHARQARPGQARHALQQSAV